MIKWIKNIINLNRELEELSNNQMRLSMGISDLYEKIEELQNKLEGK